MNDWIIMGWLVLYLACVFGLIILVTEGLRRVIEWYDNKNPGELV